MSSSPVSSIGSLPDPDDVLFPNAMFCKDCNPSKWAPRPNANRPEFLDFSLGLCDLHKADFFAAPVNIRVPVMTTPSTSIPPQQRPVLSPSPSPVTSRQQRTHPGATQRLPHASISQQAPNSNGPLSIPVQQQPRLPLHVPRSRSNIIQGCIDTYESVLVTMRDPRQPCTQKEALKKLKISERTFGRRRYVAELNIVDDDKLEEIAGSLINQGCKRLPLEKLNTLCQCALRTRTLATAKAVAVACGRLV